MHTLRILIQLFLSFYDICMKQIVIFIEVTTFVYILRLFF